MSDTRTLHALETNDGMSYLDIASITMIGNRFQKGDYPFSRRLVQGHTLTTYILDSEANYQALKDILPPDAPSWPETGATASEKKKKNRTLRGKAARNAAKTEED